MDYRFDSYRILAKGMIWRARKLVAKLRNKDEEVKEKDKDKKKKKDKGDDKTATDKRDSPKKVSKTTGASTSTTEAKEKHSDEKEVRFA